MGFLKSSKGYLLPVTCVVFHCSKINFFTPCSHHHKIWHNRECPQSWQHLLIKKYYNMAEAFNMTCNWVGGDGVSTPVILILIREHTFVFNYYCDIALFHILIQDPTWSHIPTQIYAHTSKNSPTPRYITDIRILVYSRTQKWTKITCVLIGTVLRR